MDSFESLFSLKDIFAISTNLEEFMLVKSSASSKEPKFSSTHPFKIIFPGMGDESAAIKDRWLNDHSLILDVIYTILKKELKNSSRRKSAKMVSFICIGFFKLHNCFFILFS